MKDLLSKDALEMLLMWRDCHTTLRLTVAGSSIIGKYEGTVSVAPITVDTRIALAAGWPDKAWGFDLADARLIRGSKDVLEVTIGDTRYTLTITRPN
jgi:hypothetical protein